MGLRRSLDTRYSEVPLGGRRVGVSSMKFARLAPIAAATAAATVAFPATTHADITRHEFQSPSGDIVCAISTGSDGTGGVFCDTGTYGPPPYRPDCPQGWGVRFGLDQGSAPVSQCQEDTIIPGSIPRNRGLGTLAYGKTASAGTITCDSEPTGMTCTDSNTGHFFRVSQESYQLG
jgi:hypothetical protein